jgi:hypothetical protein
MAGHSWETLDPFLGSARTKVMSILKPIFFVFSAFLLPSTLHAQTLNAESSCPFILEQPQEEQAYQVIEAMDVDALKTDGYLSVNETSLAHFTFEVETVEEPSRHRSFIVLTAYAKSKVIFHVSELHHTGECKKTAAKLMRDLPACETLKEFERMSRL